MPPQAVTRVSEYRNQGFLFALAQEGNRVRLAVPPELSTWLTERVTAYPCEAPERLQWLAGYVAEAGALPLYAGWTETIGLRPDGEVVSWSTEGEYPGTRPVEDQGWLLTALVKGVNRYPELRLLLPERPPNARDCWHLCHPFFAEGKVTCSECYGLGWLES
jgi:hypothetical protein